MATNEDVTMTNKEIAYADDGRRLDALRVLVTGAADSLAAALDSYRLDSVVEGGGHSDSQVPGAYLNSVEAVMSEAVALIKEMKAMVRQ